MHSFVPFNPISKRFVAVVLHLEPQTHRERPARTALNGPKSDQFDTIRFCCACRTLSNIMVSCAQ